MLLLLARDMATAGREDALAPMWNTASAIWAPAAAQEKLSGLDLRALRHALLFGSVAVPFVSAMVAVPVSRVFAHAAG